MGDGGSDVLYDVWTWFSALKSLSLLDILKWISAPPATITLAVVVGRLPFVWAKRLSYAIRPTPLAATKLAEAYLHRARRRRGHRPTSCAIYDIGVAVSVLEEALAKFPGWEDHLLKSYCATLDTRVAWNERSGENWFQVTEDLRKIMDRRKGVSQDLPPLYERLADAEDQLAHAERAAALHRQADILRKTLEVPQNAPAILRLWPALVAAISFPTDPTLQEITDRVRTLAKQNPTDVNSAYAEGLVELTGGNAEAALRSFNRAIASNRQFPPLYYWRARVLALTKEWRVCIEDCSVFIGSSDVPTRESYWLRGFAYYQMDQLNEAVADFSRAIGVDPGYVDPHRHLVWARARMGQWTVAIEECDRAIGQGILDAAIFTVRAEAHRKLGRMGQAIADCSEALRLSPSFGEAHRIRGLAFQQEGKLDEAIEDFSVAIDRNGDDALSYAYRGDI